MATRFYLPSSGTSPLPSLAGHTGWFTDATPNARRPMSTSKTSTALVETGEVSTGASQERINIQFVSAQQLAAQTFADTDTYSGVIKMREDNANRNMFIATVAYIVSSDGSTVRGTLYDDTFGNSDIEISTTESTRGVYNSFIGTKNTVVAEDGDYLVFEVGFAVNASGVAGTCTQQFLDNNASDYALSSGLTTDLNPWFETSRNIVWWTPPTNTNQLMMMGAGT